MKKRGSIYLATERLWGSTMVYHGKVGGFRESPFEATKKPSRELSVV